MMIGNDCSNSIIFIHIWCSHNRKLLFSIYGMILVRNILSLELTESRSYKKCNRKKGVFKEIINDYNSIESKKHFS